MFSQSPKRFNNPDSFTAEPQRTLKYRGETPLRCFMPIFYLVVLSITSSAQTDWPNVGNDKGAQRYSALTQINRDNVKELKVAWTYHTGDAGNQTTIQCTPIVINGVLYLTTATA